MTRSDLARALVAKADEEIRVLGILRDTPEASDAIWGFHAQQAVEKLLKALLAYYEIRFPFTHRLVELADLLDSSKRPLRADFDSLLDLTPYAAELRYPPMLSGGASSPPLPRKALLDEIEELRTDVRHTIGSME